MNTLSIDELFMIWFESSKCSCNFWTLPSDLSVSKLMSFSSNGDDCRSWLSEEAGLFFPTRPHSAEEAAFPLAFSLVVAQNPEQFLRLFSSIYWPQNLYCIAVDDKADFLVKGVIEKVVSCFSNVHLSPRREAIYWGTFEVLSAAIGCLEVLVEQKQHQWKYHQVVSWNDVALKTNLEMVQILRIFNGSSDSELLPGQDFRYSNSISWIPKDNPIPTHLMGKKPMEQFDTLFFFGTRKSHPPERLTVYKGSFSATISRKVAELIVTNRVVRNFTDWLKDTLVADESLWATVIHNWKVFRMKGLFDGQSCLRTARRNKKNKQWISRFQIWPGQKNFHCGGKMVHGSCALGVRDLPALRSVPHLFAHKFYQNFEPAAIFCMSELIANRTEFPLFDGGLNFTFYRRLSGPRLSRLQDPTLLEKRNHYDVLGVSRTASQKEIRAAYITLSKQLHPDTSSESNTVKFQRIQEAYHFLRKPELRRQYEMECRFPSSPNNTHQNNNGTGIHRSSSPSHQQYDDPLWFYLDHRARMQQEWKRRHPQVTVNDRAQMMVMILMFTAVFAFFSHYMYYLSHRMSRRGRAIYDEESNRRFQQYNDTMARYYDWKRNKKIIHPNEVENIRKKDEMNSNSKSNDENIKDEKWMDKLAKK